MSDARLALMAAIHGRLAADPALVALLGGPRIYDRIPRGAAFPFVTFGATDALAADSDDAPMTEHRIELEVLSRAYGRKEAGEIAARLVALLDDVPLAPAGHRLVSVRHVRTTLRPERDRQSYRAVVFFRALTEPSA